jgi:hypothetical protein
VRASAFGPHKTSSGRLFATASLALIALAGAACHRNLPSEDVCFAEHVVPLLRDDCAACHTNGEYNVKIQGRPTDYDVLRIWVNPLYPDVGLIPLLLGDVESKDHPPVWKSGSRELQTLRAWIAEGAREGCGAPDGDADADVDADADADADSDADPDVEIEPDAEQEAEPFCGDGTCNGREDVERCPEDCPALCGDDLCTHDETVESCEADCLISFSEDIVPNIRYDCAPCHSMGQWNIELDGTVDDYPRVMAYVDVDNPEAVNGFLWWAAGGGVHPLSWREGGRDYVTFLNWVLQGAENN